MALIINACWHNDPAKRPKTEELITLVHQEEMEVYQQLKTFVPALLTLACKYRKLAIVKELIATSDINERSQDTGFTPLLAACASSLTKDTPELFLLLTFRGACPFIKSEQGKTAIDLAFEMNNDSAIEKLLALIMSLQLTDKAPMSEKTLGLAKDWVKSNVNSKSLDTFYDDDFFKRLEDLNSQLNNLNKDHIKNVTNQKELYSAIEKIGFFPSSKIFNKIHVDTVVYEHFENDLDLTYIPSVYGLRNKTAELSLPKIIASVKTKEEFLQAINKMVSVTTSNGQILTAEDVKKRVLDFLNLSSPSLCDRIPKIFGLRDKAIKLLVAAAETKEELFLTMEKIDSLTIDDKKTIHDYFENSGLYENIPTSYGIGIKAREIQQAVENQSQGERITNSLHK